MVTKMFMNNSEERRKKNNLQQRCAHFAKTFCASPSALFMAKYCRFLFPRFLRIGFAISAPFSASRTLLCQIQAGWENQKKKKKRCLSFFYRIILPSDLVLSRRMSYNVTEVLSLFYFIMFCKRNISYFLHSTHKQNSISASRGEEPPLMFSLMATLRCNTLQLLWLASALISLHICFSCVCFFFLFYSL